MILFTGGGGLAGKSFKKILPSSETPSRVDLDMTCIDSIEEYLLQVEYVNAKVDTVILNANVPLHGILNEEVGLNAMKSSKCITDFNAQMIGNVYGPVYLLRRLNELHRIKDIFFMSTFRGIGYPVYRWKKSMQAELFQLLSSTKAFSGVNYKVVRPFHMDKPEHYEDLALAFKSYMESSEQQATATNHTFLHLTQGEEGPFFEPQF